MKILKLLAFGLIFGFLPFLIYSQTMKENQLVISGGEKIIIHQVRAGETIYSISRDFKIDPAQLMQKNPGSENGLNIGQTLKVPLNEAVDWSDLPPIVKGEPTGFLQHTIQTNSETAYSISKKYKITVDELYSFNPELQKFKKGLVLKIPQWETSASSKKVIAKNEIQKDPVSIEKPETIEHIVVSGETLYSLCRKYNVSESEVLFYNSDAKNLKTGTKLIIPVKKADLQSVAQSNPAQSVGYISHIIESGETMYSITRRFNISEQELKEINPVLALGFKAGTEIRIPEKGAIAIKSQSAVSEKAEGNNETKSKNDCIPQLQKSREFTIAVFLPLFIDTNDELNQNFKIPVIAENEENTEAAVDTVIENMEAPSALYKFYGNSENFLQFYEGMLIAVDSMKKEGMKVSMNVFDTKESPETVKKIVNSESFSKTDLIIGPVYENVQKEVTALSVKNDIPMVSPFTPKSANLQNNNRFFQINPTREFITEATAEMVIRKYSGNNIVVIKTGAYENTPDGQLVNLIDKGLAKNGDKRLKIYDFKKDRSRGFANVFLKDAENIVIIPSSDEGELSVAISNLNNVADTYPITLVAGANFQQKYPSIEVAHYHNLKMQYVSPYWVDYQNNETISYVEKFKSVFGTEPNSYGFQGFDSSYFFLKALWMYGENFPDCISNMKLNLTQGKYKFEKVSQTGGYMNQGVSIVSYNRNFDVERIDLR